MTQPWPPQFPPSPPPLPGAAPVPARAPGQGVRPVSRFAIGLLILACVALGITVAWGRHARHQAGRLAGELEAMRVQLALSAAQDSQLAALLTSDSAEVVSLQPADPSASPRAAVVWDRKAGDGMLFCQALWPAGAGRQYHLSVQYGHQSPTDAAAFDARSGTTVVRFHAPAGAEAAHFQVSVRPSDSAASDEVVLQGSSS